MSKCKVESVRFTDRENELFCLLKEGNTRKEAAKTMFVSVRTIETHLQSIYGKLEVKSLVEALSFNGEITVAKNQKTKWNENKAKAYKLLVSGLSPDQVAETMQFGLVTIRRWRRELRAEGRLSDYQRQPLFSCLKYIQSQNQTINNQDANYQV